METDSIEGSYRLAERVASSPLILSTIEQTLYDYINSYKGKWVSQQDIIKFYRKDDSRTRKVLIRMKNNNILESKVSLVGYKQILWRIL